MVAFGNRYEGDSVKLVPSIVIAASAALVLVGCSTSGSSGADPAPGAATTMQPTASNTPDIQDEEHDNIVDLVADDYPNEDWSPAGSPALTMTTTERATYLDIVFHEHDALFTMIENVADPTPVTEDDTRNIATMLTSGDRAGRDAFLTNYFEAAFAQTEGLEDIEYEPQVALEAAYGVCARITDGEDLLTAVTLYNDEAGFNDLEYSTDPENLGASMSNLAGTLSSYLVCPENVEAVLEGVAEMNEVP